MRLRNRAKTDRVLPVEITPMIDVVFLLIIFFMTTAQFARMTRAEVELPREPGEQQRAEEAGLVINIQRDGQIIVNEQAVTLAELVGLVDAERARTGGGSAMKLLLRADRQANAARLNEVVIHLQQLGIHTARVATEVP